MKATTPESVVLASCLELLTRRRVFHWRANQIPAPLPGGGYRKFAGLRGVSDVLCVLPGGRLVCVELKSSTGRLSPHQRAFRDRVTALGAVYLEIRDVRELAAALDRLGA